MTLVPLAALYAAIGAGCVAAWIAARRNLMTKLVSAGAIADGLLLGLLWPLYGPFLLMRIRADDSGGLAALDELDSLHPTGPSARAVAFLSALRRARATPLGELLPDEATAQALAGRLRVAARKVSEIDELLTQPAFDEQDAHRRLDGLRARNASDYAQSTAAIRVSNIRRLQALRHRFATELDEVSELLTQLTTQAEVLRIAGPVSASGQDAGDLDDDSARTLVRELVSRVEGLDQMLADV